MRNVFDGFTVDVFLDEDGEYLTRLSEMPNVSAFAETLGGAVEELKNAWELMKESYREKGKAIPQLE